MYTRDDLSVIRRSDLERPDVEGLWLEITLPNPEVFFLERFIGLRAHQSTLIPAQPHECFLRYNRVIICRE